MGGGGGGATHILGELGAVVAGVSEADGVWCRMPDAMSGGASSGVAAPAACSLRLLRERAMTADFAMVLCCDCLGACMCVGGVSVMSGSGSSERLSAETDVKGHGRCWRCVDAGEEGGDEEGGVWGVEVEG